MNEKQKIEVATAKGFLRHYNVQYRTSFSVHEVSDSPDVICRSEDGAKLGVEVTLTEDSRLDIAAMLGRSDHRDLGNQNPQILGVSLQEGVTENLLARIREKMKKRYDGSNALVVRSVSGVDWDWDVQLKGIQDQLINDISPYTEGVWLLNLDMDRIFRIK